MRQIRSYGVNLTYIITYFIFILGIKDHDEFTNIFLVSICPLILFSINVVCADSQGISKYFYPLNARYKFYSWDEIKYYIEVTEEYNHKYGVYIYNTLWLIDKKDKLLMRIKKNRTNVKKLYEVVNRFEDKSEIKIYLKNPYLKRLRLRKVVPVNEVSQLSDFEQNILLNLKKRKLSGENIDKIAEEMNLKHFL